MGNSVTAIVVMVTISKTVTKDKRLCLGGNDRWISNTRTLTILDVLIARNLL